MDEGFGLPILEAMASGTPVITSNITSLPEIGGEAVITANPYDINELAEAMHQVLTDKNLREKMVKSGLHRAKEFAWKKTVDQTKDLYSRLLKK